VIALRPIGLGEILDGSIATIRQQPKATLGPSAVVMTIATAISTASAAVVLPGLRSLNDRLSAGQPLTTADLTSASGWLALSFLVSLVLTLAVSVLLTGMLAPVVARAVLGQRTTAGQAWQHARGRFGALAGLTVLVIGIFIGLWGVLIGLAIAAAVVLGPPGAVIGVVAVLALLPLTCYAWTKISLAAPALVLERIGPAAAIGRSWRLTRRSFWRMFGIWIVAVLVTSIAALVLEVPFRIISSLATGTSGLGFSSVPSSVTGTKLLAYLIIGAVGSLLAATVIRPMLVGVATLLYADLRMRREGFDMTLQTAAGGGAGSSAGGGGTAADDEFTSVWRTPAPGTWPTQGQWQAGPAPGMPRW
jgi:hypothetical protein